MFRFTFLLKNNLSCTKAKEVWNPPSIQSSPSQMSIPNLDLSSGDSNDQNYNDGEPLTSSRKSESISNEWYIYFTFLLRFLDSFFLIYYNVKFPSTLFMFKIDLAKVLCYSQVFCLEKVRFTVA